MFVQFGRFLVPMLLTFLRNHPYHYLGKKARPELPNEGPDDPMCCSSTGTSPASSDTGAGKPHLCHLGFKLTSVFPQRDVKSTFMSYNGTAFTWLMQIMPALFGMPVTLDNTWQPSYISCSSFWLFATSTSVRLQWQSWRQGDFYPKTTHHSGAGFDSSFGRLRFCCCQWHLQRGSAGLMCFFWISNQDSMGTWQQKFSSIKK